MKKICVFQMNYTDLDQDNLMDCNAVEIVKDSGIFEHVVLAVPDLPQNKVLEQYANKWGVDIYYGNVDNVIQRIKDVTEKYGCEIICRLLVGWFFLDTKLIKKMIDRLVESGADYVNLPADFDIRFGGDVFNINFLNKVLAISNDDDKKFLKFNPFGYAENHPDEFNIVTETIVPTYGEEKFHELRNLMKKIWPERWDFTNAPMVPYDHARDMLNKGEKVLDISCGYGAGTKVLAKEGISVIGVDNCPKTIERAKELCSAYPNIKLITSDAYELNFAEEEFDVIVSVHTMEHLKDDILFLKMVHKWLKKGGIFILEVPLRTIRPFITVKTPLRPFHEKEYIVSELRDLLIDNDFTIINAFGVSREYYGNENNARDAAMYILKK